jgi:virulence-associated protein VapD
MDEYQKYIRKKEEMQLQESLMKARLNYIQYEKEQEEKRKKEKDEPEISIPVTVAEKQREFSEVDEQKLKIENIHSEITSELGKTTKTFTDINQNAKIFKSILSKVEENKLVNSDTNEENKLYLSEAQKILTKQVEDFLQTDQALDKLTNQLNTFIEDLSLDEESLEGDSWDTSNKFDLNNQILSDSLNKVIEKSQIDLKELHESEAKNTDGTIEMGEDGEKKIAHVDTVESDDKLKKLEDKIVESLSKSSKYAEKFKSGDIKIKIISFNAVNGEDQDESLKNLLSGYKN